MSRTERRSLTRSAERGARTRHTREPDPLACFSAPVQRWFRQTFTAPTPPQRLGWPEVAAGRHTLICAPTGSGKTLAAFLWCIDELVRREDLPPSIHTLYISPLKALGYDVDHNLRAPLRGIRTACDALGLKPPAIQVAVRTGDTPSSQRARMLRHPPHLLITTPESLFILLTSPRVLPLLSSVRYVVLDEIHALCGNKRGVSLALALERLGRLQQQGEPVRIGLSATVHPMQEAALFLGGHDHEGRPRPVQVVDGGRRKELDLQVVAPVADFTQLPEDSVWPEVQTLLLDWIRQHRSTLIFVRMRAQAERLSRALNELAGHDLTRAHHGSLSREVRRELERQLKQGRLPALVSTGTLELGIDVGAIDLVVQVGSPGAVSSGLQRVGRAGHLLDARSRGRLLPLHREDLVECAVIGRRMLQGELEPVQMPHNALDVLAQHLLSATAMCPTTGQELLQLAHGAAPYQRLTRPALDSVLALLAGRFPADVARGLSAKLVWERSTDRVSALPGAGRLAVTTGGTIPDSGYFALQLPDGTRLGELEEEFVFERRVGDTIAFGSGTWRITTIDRQRVVVAPAPGGKAVIPFWKGGLFGRDPGLSQAIGAFRRELYQRVERPPAAEAWLLRRYPLDPWAASNLVHYFAEQRRRGALVGTDQQVVLELFRDDLGDHNLLLHSTFGNRINAPWGMALRALLRQRLGVDPQLVSDDNAILIRLPAGEAPPPDDLLRALHSDAVRELVTDELAGSAMYGTLFRQNAGRFLVLGTHGVGRRTPLWLQRLRAKDLQQATASMPDFPVRLETYRQCLQQLMDLPRLEQLLDDIANGTVRTVVQPRDQPSPVASGLLNRFIGQYMYEYDEPRGERTLRRLQLDRELLDQVLGRQDAHELLLPGATAELEQQWQGRGERSRARNADELLALVLRMVLLPVSELGAHVTGDPGPLVELLLQDTRLSRYVLGDGDPHTWLCATEDLPLLLRALQPRRPRVDPPRSLTSPTARPALVREQLLARVVQSLGPSSLQELQQRTGFEVKPLQAAVKALTRRGLLRAGHFRADLDQEVVCSPLNLEQIRRRSLTHVRRQVEPVPPPVLQRLAIDLATGVDTLALRPIPVEVLERDLLPLRIPGYRAGMIDDQVASGALLWTGAGQGRVVLCPRADVGLLPPPPIPQGTARVVFDALQQRGASFVADLASALPQLSISELVGGLWDLVWAGLATNDQLATLRQGLACGFAPAPPAPPHSTGRGRRPRLVPTSSPFGAGRWSLLPPLGTIDPERLVGLLVQRHGLVARSLVELEPMARWSELYPVLCQLELCGELARGVFVEGLGGAQFAPSGTVDRLRKLRDALEAVEPVLINSCDPALVAQALGLPVVARRPSTYLVLDRGLLVLTLETTSARLQLDPAPETRQRERLKPLGQLLKRGFRAVRLERINDSPALRSPLRPVLESLGYRVDGRVLEIRRFG